MVKNAGKNACKKVSQFKFYSVLRALSNKDTSNHSNDILVGGAGDINYSRSNDSNDILVGGAGDTNDKSILYMNVSANAKKGISASKLYNILSNPDRTKISTLQPIKPKAGEVYVIDCTEHPERVKDHTADKYTWNTDKRHTFKIPGQDIGGQKMYYYLRDEDGHTDRRFRKMVSNLENNELIQIVEYYGDETLYNPRPHGNSKDPNAPEWNRTAPSAQNRIVAEAESGNSTPSNIYIQLVSENTDSSRQGVSNPRNREQVRNYVKKVRNSKRLCRDDLASLYLMGNQMENFVHELSLIPQLECIIGLDEIFNEFNDMLTVQSDECVLIVAYDTTFQLGDFYVSPILFRHILFEGSPVIPLAFLIHDRKYQDCHERLFARLAKKIPNLKKKKIPIILDRETALKNAVKAQLPNLLIAMCWNHLRTDVKHWVNKHGGRSDDLVVYTKHLEDLLKSETKDEYDTKLKEYKDTWSESFVAYFEDSLEPDILAYSIHFVIKEYKIYNPISGITNNVSEGLNSVLKRFMKYKEVPLDTFCFSMYLLQNFYLAEIRRGMVGAGDFILRSRFKNCQMDPVFVKIPKAYSIEEIIEFAQTDELANMVPNASENSNESARSGTVNSISRENSNNLDRSGITDSSQSENNLNTSAASDIVENITNQVPAPSTSYDPPVDTFDTDVHDAPTSNSNGETINNSEPSQVSGNNGNQELSKDIGQIKMAEALISKNKIQHVPEMATFLVEGYEGRKYNVQTHPKPTCSCAATTTCYHILAVQMSCGINPTKDTRKLNLNRLKKNSRARADKTSGRKRPRKNDLDYTPAPDSIIATTPSKRKRHGSNESEFLDDISTTSTPSRSRHFSNNSGIFDDISTTSTPSRSRHISDKNSTTPSKRVRINDEITVHLLPESPAAMPLPDYPTKDIQDWLQKNVRSNLADLGVSPLPQSPNNKKSSEGVDARQKSPKRVSTQKKTPKNVGTPEKSPKGAGSKSKSNQETNKLQPRAINQVKKHWVEIDTDCQLSHDEKAIIKNNKWLNCRIMKGVNRLCIRDFGDRINGFQDVSLAPKFSDDLNRWTFPDGGFEGRTAPTCNIHHTGRGHWVTSVRYEDNGPVYLLDSYLSLDPKTAYMSVSVEIQLAKIYGKNSKELTILMPEIQRQTNSLDCGLYAIANMIEFVYNRYDGLRQGKLKFNFAEDKMRDHLIKCLENKKMTPFPKSDNKTRKFKMHSDKIDLYCCCFLPQHYDAMVECEKCRLWFFQSCKNPTPEELKGQYFCEKCKQ